MQCNYIPRDNGRSRNTIVPAAAVSVSFSLSAPFRFLSSPYAISGSASQVIFFNSLRKSIGRRDNGAVEITEARFLARETKGLVYARAAAECTPKSQRLSNLALHCAKDSCFVCILIRNLLIYRT
jgi:hypothetical protein